MIPTFILGVKFLCDDDDDDDDSITVRDDIQFHLPRRNPNSRYPVRYEMSEISAAAAIVSRIWSLTICFVRSTYKTVS